MQGGGKLQGGGKPRPYNTPVGLVVVNLMVFKGGGKPRPYNRRALQAASLFS